MRKLRGVVGPYAIRSRGPRIDTWGTPHEEECNELNSD